MAFGRFGGLSGPSDRSFGPVRRSMTRIVAPVPWPSLSAWMRPPVPITKFAAECRPSPLPPSLVV